MSKLLKAGFVLSLLGVLVAVAYANFQVGVIEIAIGHTLEIEDERNEMAMKISQLQTKILELDEKTLRLESEKDRLAYENSKMKSEERAAATKQQQKEKAPVDGEKGDDGCKIVYGEKSSSSFTVSEFETLINDYDFESCGGSDNRQFYKSIDRYYRDIVDRYCYDVVEDSSTFWICPIIFDKNKHDILSNISFQCKKMYYDDDNRKDECYYKTGIVEIQKVGTKYIYQQLGTKHGTVHVNDEYYDWSNVELR